MSFKKIAFLFLIIILAGCFNTQTSSDEIIEIKPELKEDKVSLRNSFIGKWYSEQPTKEGGVRKTTIERVPDSRYLVTFEVYDKENQLTLIQKEFGLWGVSGGVYFTMFKGWVENDEFNKADPNDAYNYDSYKIISTSSNELEYQSLSTGNKFTYIKAR